MHLTTRRRFGVCAPTVSALLLSVVCTVGPPASDAAVNGPPGISASSFRSDFSAMRAFKALASAGRGKLAAILPDAVSSTRYVELDQPDITRALRLAGLKPSQYVVQNARGSDLTELSDARSDMANGASVLLVDPLDSDVGAQIERAAKSRGVKVVDYDRLTLGGSRAYYVGFDNVQVGRTLGQGLVSCVRTWHVAMPRVVVMEGGTGIGATLLAQGYNAVMKPYFASGKWTDVVNTAGTSNPSAAETEFQAAYTTHQGVNAALVPDDETGAPIVTYLQARHVKPDTFPITGQDATVTGLQNILSGYQCGTAYKPVYTEAQAAVSLALYLRAKQTPPAALVNGTTPDTVARQSVPSVLLDPEWVTKGNMKATVIGDRFVTASQLCAGSYARACAAAGIRR